MNDIIYLLQYFKVPGMAVPCLHIDVVVFPIDHTETRVTYPPIIITLCAPARSYSQRPHVA